MKTLRVILGDQLNLGHSWFKDQDDSIIYTMMEIIPEMNYATHHVQKALAFMHAMRSFSEEIKILGHRIHYIKLSDKSNKQSFLKNISQIITKQKITHIEFQEPDEYRLDQEIKNICKKLRLNFKIVSAEHFLTSRDDLGIFFEGKKIWRMEDFYREMRRKYLILMNGKKPLGGKWNFDHDNRSKWKSNKEIPKRIKFDHDVSNLFNELKSMKVKTIGDVDTKKFNWPKNRDEALLILNQFIVNYLNDFGEFQDSMSNDNKFLFHSLISFAMNSKMINPEEVVNEVIKKLDSDLNNINSVEGFIRQIIGWREYIRGIYWNKMPGYEKSNFMKFNKKLPDFFWNAQTKMNCLNKSIKQSLETAYAHHIQRLMIIGNFMLLIETDPKWVHEWFLGIYIDAIEWVELPNVIGMSQYADGGLLATKPYVSSGSYINKMGDYCGSCKYNVKTKFEKDSCPFNVLYWNFFLSNNKLLDNPRMGIVKMQLNRMSADDQNSIKIKSRELLENIESL